MEYRNNFSNSFSYNPVKWTKFVFDLLPVRRKKHEVLRCNNHFLFSHRNAGVDSPVNVKSTGVKSRMLEGFSLLNLVMPLAPLTNTLCYRTDHTFWLSWSALASLQFKVSNLLSRRWVIRYSQHSKSVVRLLETILRLLQ